MKRRKISGLTC